MLGSRQAEAEDATADAVDYEPAARVIGVKPVTLRTMVHRGQVPHFRIGPRTVRFSIRELREWLNARRVPASQK